MSSFTTKAVKGGAFRRTLQEPVRTQCAPPLHSCDGVRGAPSRGPAAVSSVCAPLCCLGTSLAPRQASKSPREPVSLRRFTSPGTAAFGGWRSGRTLRAPSTLGLRRLAEGFQANYRYFAFPGLSLTDACLGLLWFCRVGEACRFGWLVWRGHHCVKSKLM